MALGDRRNIDFVKPLLDLLAFEYHLVHTQPGGAQRRAVVECDQGAGV